MGCFLPHMLQWQQLPIHIHLSMLCGSRRSGTAASHMSQRSGETSSPWSDRDPRPHTSPPDGSALADQPPASSRRTRTAAGTLLHTSKKTHAKLRMQQQSLLACTEKSCLFQTGTVYKDTFMASTGDWWWAHPRSLWWRYLFPN